MSAPKRPRNEQRFTVLEHGQRETNTRLGRIEDTLRTSSHLFELMHERLEHVEESQHSVVDRLDKLVEISIRDRTDRLAADLRVQEALKVLADGNRAVVDRLDRVIDATLRDRTATSDRIRAVERRLDVVEQQLTEREPPP